MTSGLVKPILLRRLRLSSGMRPRMARRYTARFQPPSIFWSMGSLKMNSTSSWSRKGTRASMENAIEFLSS